MPRVVIGDDHPVGQPGGDGAHLRALAPVALAAATEHAPQASAAQRAQGKQRGLERIRGMGVINHQTRPTRKVPIRGREAL